MRESIITSGLGEGLSDNTAFIFLHNFLDYFRESRSSKYESEYIILLISIAVFIFVVILL